MEFLKFGVIGFLIMMPFIFLGLFGSHQDYYREQMEYRLKIGIEEAVYDGAFAMKTYSESYYDSQNTYQIDIPYDQVIDVFFNSLEYRDFGFVKDDFPLLMFVDYDGVLLYSTKTGDFFPKVYYTRRSGDVLTYYNLGESVIKIDLLTSVVTEEMAVDVEKENVILSTIEKALNKAVVGLDLNDKYVFELPVYDDGYGKLPINDLSFTAFYISGKYYGMGFENYTSMKPSGVLKMKEIITY